MAFCPHCDRSFECDEESGCDELAAARAENERLRELVRQAYCEGCKAGRSGLADEDDFQDTRSYAALGAGEAE